MIREERGFSRTAALRAYEKNSLVVTTNAQDDDHHRDNLSVVNLDLRYIVAIPLSVQGVASGTIYLDSRRPGRFDEETICLLESLADQAAIAFMNAKLRTENMRRQRLIKRMNDQLRNQLANRDGELERFEQN